VYMCEVLELLFAVVKVELRRWGTVFLYSVPSSPSLSFPFPFSFSSLLPLFFLSFPFPFPPLPLEVGPVTSATGSGECCNLSKGFGVKLQLKSNLVHFSFKILHLLAPILLRVTHRSRCIFLVVFLCRCVFI